MNLDDEGLEVLKKPFSGLCGKDLFVNYECGVV